MRIEAAGLSHVGRKRDHNEDNYLLLPEQNLFVVADGMGGHGFGEVASKIAVDEMDDFFRMTGDDEDRTWPFKMDKSRSYDENRVIVGIRCANGRILEKSKSDPKYGKMGTTMVCTYYSNGTAYIGWAGDSRCYRYRGGELHQLSEDHSLLNDLIRKGSLTQDQIANFPHKNVIVRALGQTSDLVPDVVKDDPEEDDVFLLCSDGLSGMVPDPKIQDFLDRDVGNLEKACGTLIDAANAAGGVDNITAVLMRFHKD